MTKSNFRLYYTSCLVSLLLILIYSCKDKHNSTNNPSNPTPTNCDTCHSILEAKEYFAFKAGSYWVYEEETTHERDSMFVTQSWISPSYNFNCKIISQRSGFEFTYWPSYFSNAGSCSTTGGVTGKCLFVNRNKSKTLENLGDTWAMFINYNIGDEYGTNEWGSVCTENTLKICNIHDTVTIGNLTFNRTILINESCSYHYDQQPVNLYYSQGVGIVRKELIDSNQVWNLVKYKIVN